MKKFPLLLLILSICYCPLLFAESHVSSGITLAYQGELRDMSMRPLTGLYQITFRLYDEQEQGTLLWEEIHPNVNVRDGRFDVMLGDLTPFSFEASLSPDSPLYLSIAVEEDGELSPRLKLGGALKTLVSEQATVASLADHALDVSGEHVHPAAISIGDQLIIDQEGKWVGEPPIAPTELNSLMQQDQDLLENLAETLSIQHSDLLRGEAGLDGVSINSAHIEDGQLILEQSNGETINAGEVVGPQGIQGVSITNVGSNENGQLWFVLSDGQRIELEVASSTTELQAAVVAVGSVKAIRVAREQGEMVLPVS